MLCNELPGCQWRCECIATSCDLAPQVGRPCVSYHGADLAFFMAHMALQRLDGESGASDGCMTECI